MTNKYAEVFLWGTRVGVVSYEENEKYARFEYDKNFISRGIELSPIVMPLNNRIYSFPNLNKETFKGLPGLLAESLPDRFGDKVFESWLQINNKSLEDLSPIERLCYIGKRGMGALEYVPSTGPLNNEQEKIEINKMVEIASKILNNRKDLHLNKNDINYANLLKFSTSAGGARAKAIISWNKDTGEILSGQISDQKGFDYWIIKFDGLDNNGDKDVIDPRGYTNVEYAYYLMAKDAGININECRLLKDNNLNHFMTLRFDRERETGEKLHMLSLGGLAHFDYNRPRSCSYEMAANVCLRLGIGNDEICELFRRMVFNVLTVNNDDHVKNISFLMNKKGKWGLAPAYDLCFSYKKDSYWVSEHQITVNGKSKDITLEDMLACADSMNIKKTKAINIISKVKEAANNWNKYADKAKVNNNVKNMINDYLTK